MDPERPWAEEEGHSLNINPMISDQRTSKINSQHTIHSSTGLVFPIGALRLCWRSWLSHGSRLLNGMLLQRLLL